VPGHSILLSSATPPNSSETPSSPELQVGQKPVRVQVWVFEDTGENTNPHILCLQLSALKQPINGMGHNLQSYKIELPFPRFTQGQTKSDICPNKSLDSCVG
jgi:hypothetical protein